jgi:hypothetical protein
MKKELRYDDFKVVFDDHTVVVDGVKERLLESIVEYARYEGRRVKVVFFNGLGGRQGVSFYFKKDEMV